jgi:hypothetical protein
VDTFVPSNETEGKQLEVRVEYTDAAGYVELVTKSYGRVLIVNDAPEFELADTSLVVNEDGGGQRYGSFLTGINAVDANQLIQRVSLNVTMGQALFAVLPELIWMPGDTVATLNYTPTTNVAETGSATIHVVVQDNGDTENGGEDTTTKTFTIAVNAVNDAPAFAIIDQQATEDVTHSVVFAVNDEEGPVSEFEYAISLSNPRLVNLVASKFVTANGSNIVTLNLVPMSNANGTADVVVSVIDVFGSHTVTQSFALSIYPVNDQPEPTRTDYLHKNGLPRTHLYSGGRHSSHIYTENGDSVAAIKQDGTVVTLGEC